MRANSTLPNTLSPTGRTARHRSSSSIVSTSAVAILVNVMRHPPLALVQPASRDDQTERPGEDPQVERRGAILDVPDVQLDPLLPGQRGAPVRQRRRLEVKPGITGWAQ